MSSSHLVGNCDAASDTASSSTTSSDTSSDSSSGSKYRRKVPQQTIYIEGFQMIVSRHTPPPPFGLDYDTPLPPQHPDPTSLSLEELCFIRQPRDGHTLRNITRRLIVTAQIRTGARQGPQVVVVNGDMVAKLYDPLYYDPCNHKDAVWDADKAYSCEAAAYEHLQTQTEVKDTVPAFHGTWTLDVKTTSARNGQETSYTRQVRMILIDHVKGRCMKDIKAWDLSTGARTNILKQCLHAQIRLLHTGVDHGDVCPRNVIVVGSDLVTPKVQIKLIDFEISAVHDHPRFALRAYTQPQKAFANYWAPKLFSPLKIFFGHMSEFSSRGWCPAGYDGAEKWLWEQYYEDDRYIPVHFTPPNNRFKRPLYVDTSGKISDPHHTRKKITKGVQR